MYNPKDPTGKRSKGIITAILSKHKSSDSEEMEDMPKKKEGKESGMDHSKMLAAKDVVEKVMEEDVEGAAKGLVALVELCMLSKD
jgi:hypothetical protein